MKWVRRAAIIFLLAVALACVFAERLAPADYAHQFRDIPDAPASAAHWLGTDDLGRDRFSRVLHGTRISLLLAPAAALIASFLAAVVGGTAGFVGGALERAVMSGTDLFLSLPWFFVLIAVRVLIITFALLGCLGWAAAARVVCADARSLKNSDFALQARASGSSGYRLLRHHLLPNLRPVLYAQFWISIPVFILTEANLGILGLGVSEPLPSWGSLLRELEGYSSVTSNAWQFAPLLLFISVVSCFHLVVLDRELPA